MDWNRIDLTMSLTLKYDRMTKGYVFGDSQDSSPMTVVYLNVRQPGFIAFDAISSEIHKLTVWCALWAGGIIGPYFFKNDEGHNVTVNGDRYRAMITNFFIPELNKHDFQELWFQQDGATCHTARATTDLFHWSMRISHKMLDHLEDNIRRVIADIRPQMLEKTHRKLDVQIGLHPSQPWQSYARNHT
ncbi:putative DD41D transposase [Trichonephila clavipes]|nr:putative DD41D transposase [Trichonephila clavipes]